MGELRLTIQHEAGLHARPLAQFVKTAQAFQSAVRVRNLSSGKGPADGKSPLALMLLAVLDGQEIAIDADGPDSDQALDALRCLIQTDFHVRPVA